jgi:signal transduction histidine kinase
MRIGNQQQFTIHDSHSQKVAKESSASKGITKRDDNTSTRKSDGEVRQLVEQLRSTTDDRSGLMEAVKARLAAGEYDPPAALEATAKSILHSSVA